MTALENSEGKHIKVIYEFEPFDEEENEPIEEMDNELDVFSTTCFDCVRGKKLSKWVFSSLDEKSTKIELEVAVDPKMSSFTNFFVNNYQKSWPHITMHGLINAARRRLHRDDEIQVTNVISRLFPIKI